MRSKGLAEAKEICQNPSRRAKELKEKGKKIAGYLCCFPPVEMITAADFVPYRIRGNVKESVGQATNYLIPRTCPFTLSCFELGLKGEYNFLDGFISPYSCEYVDSIYDYWCYYMRPSYHHYIGIPHRTGPLAHQFFKERLIEFKESLERFKGSALSTECLHDAIRQHNENRALVRELYDLRREDPAPLSGTEMTQIVLAAMSIPVTQSNEMLRSVIEEIRSRQEPPEKRRGRLLLWGPILDDVAFVQMVEDAGGNVVMDDVCFGSRHYWNDVEITPDPVDALATSYLKIMCPCIYRGTKVKHKDDLEYRFRYLLDYVRDFNVDGVILCTLRYCETHGHEAPDIREYLEDAGVPVLSMDYAYVMTSIAPMKTRVEAFLEMIGQRA